MMRFSNWIVLGLAFLLISCGGGGDDSGGNGGGLTLSAGSVNFTASQYGPLPTDQYVDVTITASNAAYIVVGYPPEVPTPFWLELGLSGSGNNWSVSISIRTTSIDLIPRHTTVRVLIADSDDNMIGYRDLSVGYTLTDDLSVSPQAISYSHINGDSDVPPTQSVDINGNNISWSASADQGWVTLGSTTGTSPSTLDVGIDPAGMASGTHHATLTLTDGTDSVALAVTLTVSAPSFSLAPGTITLGGSDGTSFAPQALQFRLPTGSNAYLWTATLETDSGTSWLLSDVSSGTVSGTSATINLNCSRAGLSSGTHTGTVSLRATVNGDVVNAVVPVTLNMEAHKLFAADNGVALSDMPTIHHLSHAVEIQDTYGWLTTEWSATSNQSWLDVTASGFSGDELTLTADSTSLVTNTLYRATVTVTSSDPTIENSEIIQVGFWVGDSDPSSPTSIPSTYSEVVADTIRPYAYVHNGGTEIDIYNVYTGDAPVATIAVTGAQQLGPMAMSSDGLRLYASDLISGQIIPVDLQTQNTGTAWDLANVPMAMRLAYAHPKGYDVVLASDGYAYNALTGERLLEAFEPNGNIATSKDSSLFFVQRAFYSPARLFRYAMDYSMLNDQGLIIEEMGQRSDVGPARDLAVSADGLRLYTACSAPYQFTYYDSATFDLLGDLPAAAYPNNIHVASNGWIYGASNRSMGPTDLWVYTNTDNLQDSYFIAGYGEQILSRQMTISGDALRIIALTTEPALKFVTGP